VTFMQREWWKHAFGVVKSESTPRLQRGMMLHLSQLSVMTTAE
jgi:hypothetical protein